MGVDFARPRVGVALRDGRDPVGVSAPDTLAVDASRRGSLSEGLTVVVVDADEGCTGSGVAPTLFIARYDKYDGPEVLACLEGGDRTSSSSSDNGDRLVHRSISRSVVSPGRLLNSARP